MGKESVGRPRSERGPSTRIVAETRPAPGRWVRCRRRHGVLSATSMWARSPHLDMFGFLRRKKPTQAEPSTSASIPPAAEPLAPVASDASALPPDAPTRPPDAFDGSAPAAPATPASTEPASGTVSVPALAPVPAAAPTPAPAPTSGWRSLLSSLRPGRSSADAAAPSTPEPTAVPDVPANDPAAAGPGRAGPTDGRAPFGDDRSETAPTPPTASIGPTTSATPSAPAHTVRSARFNSACALCGRRAGVGARHPRRCRGATHDRAPARACGRHLCIGPRSDAAPHPGSRD